MAEEKAEAALDQALDSERLKLAGHGVRDELCDIWNAPDAPLRARLEESMHSRADRRHKLVVEQLEKRQAADIQRARDIFAAFRTNLLDALDLLRSKEAEAEAMLWADEQQKQRRRDIESMQRRFDELDDEENREITAITDRYADVKPHTTAAAVVFALTPEDARKGLQ
jgi:predicted transcriptional regulator